MSWEYIRDIGLLMFVSGGMLLFAVALGQYFDPPQPGAWIRSIFDSWMWSTGDVLMIGGACLALVGIVVGYLTFSTDSEANPRLGHVFSSIRGIEPVSRASNRSLAGPIRILKIRDQRLAH
jgi:hypothetical protein